MEQMVIRPVTESDLPDLEWKGEYQHFRRLYAEAFHMMQNKKAILWVAVLPGVGLIGQLFVQLSSGRNELANGSTRAYIYGFRIKPDYQNHGIGTQMMQIAEKDLAQRGFQWITLNVGRDNPGARRLYERLGFRVVANEPGRWSYQDDQGMIRQVNEPAWRMEKRLAAR